MLRILSYFQSMAVGLGNALMGNTYYTGEKIPATAMLAEDDQVMLTEDGQTMLTE